MYVNDRVPSEQSGKIAQWVSRNKYSNMQVRMSRPDAAKGACPRMKTRPLPVPERDHLVFFARSSEKLRGLEPAFIVVVSNRDYRERPAYDELAARRSEYQLQLVCWLTFPTGRTVMMKGGEGR